MMPPTYSLADLPNQAQKFASNCPNEKLAMTVQYVALGSMVVLAGCAAAQMVKDLFCDRGSERGYGR